MKLHILNDLHVEFADFNPPATDADVVILAGDIGVGRQGLDWAAERFSDRPVIYVPGNHEFYHHDIALVEELKSQAPDHVHDAFDYSIRGTRVTCNPRGYAPEQLTPGFRPEFVVEV